MIFPVIAVLQLCIVILWIDRLYAKLSLSSHPRHCTDPEN